MDYLKENEKTLAAFCLLHGIVSISVQFDGSGDSGQIDGVAFYKQGHVHFNPEGLNITFWKTQGNVWDPATKQWTQPEPKLEEHPVKVMVEQHVYDLLERTDIDWYNNYGGYGSWEWSAEDGKAKFNVYVRIVESDHAHASTYTLGTAEDDNDSEPLETES